MAETPRTSAEIGLDAHVRYARDVELLEKYRHLIKDSDWVSEKTTVTTAAPYSSFTDFDIQFSLPKPVSVAHFSPPPTGTDRQGFFFQTGILPLDSYEKQEALLEKLATFEENLKNLPSSTSAEFHQIKEAVETKDKLTRMFQLIKARLNQFQRG